MAATSNVPRVLDEHVPLRALSSPGGLRRLLQPIARPNLRIAAYARLPYGLSLDIEQAEDMLLARLDEVMPESKVAGLRIAFSAKQQSGSATVACDSQLRLQDRGDLLRATRYRPLVMPRECRKCGHVYWPHGEDTIWCLPCWRRRCLLESDSVVQRLHLVYGDRVDASQLALLRDVVRRRASLDERLHAMDAICLVPRPVDPCALAWLFSVQLASIKKSAWWESLAPSARIMGRRWRAIRLLL